MYFINKLFREYDLNKDLSTILLKKNTCIVKEIHSQFIIKIKNKTYQNFI